MAKVCRIFDIDGQQVAVLRTNDAQQRPVLMITVQIDDNGPVIRADVLFPEDLGGAKGRDKVFNEMTGADAAAFYRRALTEAKSELERRADAAETAAAPKDEEVDPDVESPISTWVCCVELTTGEALEVRRLPGGVIVGLDSSYLDQVFDEDAPPYSPYDAPGTPILFPLARNGEEDDDKVDPQEVLRNGDRVGVCLP
jgi:hypothetical protein